MLNPIKQKNFNVDYEAYKNLKVNFSIYEKPNRSFKDIDNEDEVSIEFNSILRL